MAVTITRKSGDFGKPIVLDLSRQGANADPVDLTGATVRLQATSLSGVLLDAVMTVVTPTDPARVSYTPIQGELVELGKWQTEVDVIYSGNSGKETFPSSELQLFIDVERSIG